MNKHDSTEQFVQLMTSPPSTAAGGTLGFMMAWIIQNAPAIISLLTICVLICQLIAWGIRGYRGWKEVKLAKAAQSTDAPPSSKRGE